MRMLVPAKARTWLTSPPATAALIAALGSAILYAVTLGSNYEIDLAEKGVPVTLPLLIFSITTSLASVAGMGVLASFLFFLVAGLFLITCICFDQILRTIDSSTGKEVYVAASVTLAAIIYQVIGVRFKPFQPLGKVTPAVLGVYLVIYRDGTSAIWAVGKDLSVATALVMAVVMVLMFLVTPVLASWKIRDVSATVINLISRGYLNVAEMKDEKDLNEIEIGLVSGSIQFQGLILASRFEISLYRRPLYCPQQAYMKLCHYAVASARIALSAHRFPRFEQLKVTERKRLHLAAGNCARALGAAIADPSLLSNVLPLHAELLEASTVFLKMLHLSNIPSDERSIAELELLGASLLHNAVKVSPECISTAKAEDKEAVSKLEFFNEGRKKPPLIKRQQALRIELDKMTEQKTFLVPAGSSSLCAISQVARPSDSWRQKLWYSFSEATGFRKWQLIFLLQFSAAYLVAVILTVAPLSDGAFYDKGFWIVIAVVMLSGYAASSILIQTRNRILGTVLAVIISSIAVTCGFLASGLSYRVTPASAGVSSTVLAIFMAFTIYMKTSVGPNWQYCWFVATFVPQLLLLSVPGTDKVWEPFLYRLITNVLGAMLMTLMAILLFPILAHAHVEQITSQVLEELATLVDVGVAYLLHPSVAAQNKLEAQGAKVGYCIRDLEQMSTMLVAENKSFLCRMLVYNLPWVQKPKIDPEVQLERMGPLIQSLQAERVAMLWLSTVLSWYGSSPEDSLDNKTEIAVEKMLKLHGVRLRELALVARGLLPAKAVDKRIEGNAAAALAAQEKATPTAVLFIVRAVPRLQDIGSLMGQALFDSTSFSSHESIV